jgi:diacylglycerol kinase (ATP)
VRVVVNPSARSGRAGAALRRVRAAHPGVEWLVSDSPRHLQSLVRDAEAGGEGALGLAGGDGTVALAAAALDRPNRVPWRVLPVGSGNDFAAHLGISRPSLDGEVRRVDLGRAGGRAFCCVATLGLDALALEIVHRSRWPRSRALNLYASLRGLMAWQPREVRIRWQGGGFAGPIMFAAVTNTRSYAGGFRVCPDARLDDGRLDVCIVGAAGRGRLLRKFPRIFRGTHAALPEVVMAQSPWVTIESDAPLPVALDGELPSLYTPLEIICEPAALAVLA